ncbi:MAG TPA: EAL domain-containing protein [Acetobacteraceae bacterium]|jgi:diguanylate cyclase (GGDEF)-like protein
MFARWSRLWNDRRARVAAPVPQAIGDAAFHNTQSGIAQWDAAECLVAANDRVAAMFGLRRECLQPGLSFRDFIGLSVETGHLDGRDADEVYALAMPLIRRRTPVTYDEQLSAGRVLRVAYRPLDDGGWLATYEDVTEHQQAQAQVAFMALHDSLTNLANRALLLDRLQEALARVGEVAVLFIDLDRFKEVNDTLGHRAGDMLLRFVASRLSNSFRQSDTLGRLGGDEFAVVLTPGSHEAAAAAARQIIDVLGRRFEIDGHDVTIGASVGIALAPADGADRDTLVKNADLALYAAKADGRGTFRFFEQTMQDRLRVRRALETDLRSAIALQRLELFYQPLVSTRTGTVAGLEALMRWRDPDRGMVPPSEFIPVAEASGLIVPLGAWSIERACADLALLPPHLRVAVNLSAVQFGSDALLPTVRDCIAAAGVAPGRLELEVTESTLMHDTARAVAVLDALRAEGVRIAMDDFGTGYSSLSYIRNFPFDKVKIDKSFIDDLGQPRGSDAIVRAVAGIANSLGIETVAEGVERLDQYRRVAAEGCDLVQGFLFSRPVPLEDVPRVVAAIDAGAVVPRSDSARPALTVVGSGRNHVLVS